MLQSRPACRRLSEQDGSGRRVVCHQRCSGSLRSRSPAGISRLRSGRRSRCFACRATLYGRSLAGSRGRPRRSPGSCGATPPHEAAAWSIARDNSALARRADCSSSQAGKACAQGGIANLCGGTAGWHRRRSGRGSCSRPGGVLERPAAGTAPGSAVGKRLEPRVDCPALAGRLPG